MPIFDRLETACTAQITDRVYIRDATTSQRDRLTVVDTP
jgi:hypothetical protein